MPPTDRFVISFAAEPPQDALPYGRWADTLRNHFVAAVRELDTEDENIGEINSEITWFPDRAYGGRTYIPGIVRTSENYDVYGYVSFSEMDGPSDFTASVDFTSELAENNPDWKIDLNDEVIAGWRGQEGKTADITLVWGVPLVPGGAMVTAELADLAVDQCDLVEQRFTLIAPDNYRSDYLDIKLWTGRGELLASESLYVDDSDGSDDAEDEDEDRTASE